ncbi:MAG: ABC transporter permease [Bacteroidales bacterium]|nr:MAG: ABC transporter permease [Bacteroidales bacterium]
MNNLVFAWRNLWRNKRRTTITVTAIVVAVLMSTCMSSMQEGMYSKMIDNVVKFYSGYLQIHHNNYWESKSINDVYKPDETFYAQLDSVRDIVHYVPRVESFSLISTGENTKGGAIIGVDPESEDRLSELSRWIHKGECLKQDDDGILVAVNLAKNLKIDIGDTLILLSQGYHGATAAGLFPVKGILKFPSPDLNNFGAYVDIRKAQDFFSMPGMVTSTAILVNNYSDVVNVKNELVTKLQNSYSIMTWDEMQPEIVQMIEGDRAGAVIMKAVLYIVVGFGILGTIIMMVAERKRESGITVAIGMQKRKLQTVMFYETLYMGFLGVFFGFLLSVPLILILLNNPIPLPGESSEVYEKFGFEPVIYFGAQARVFVNQVITVFAMSLLISLYPIIKIRNLKVANALRA